MTIKPIAAIFVAALGVSACDTSPLTSGLNDGVTTKAETGALIGGVLGGIVGASSDDNKVLKGVVGAGIGAAAGGVIGNQLDKQAQELRRDIPDQRVQIENTGQELRVTLPQELLFAVDSAQLSPILEDDLRVLANNLNQNPASTINIVGHTDDTGSDAHNYDLSERRANAVAWILEGEGVSPGRIRAFGQGETQPVASNATDEGRRQNRRVEIVIRPTAA